MRATIDSLPVTPMEVPLGTAEPVPYTEYYTHQLLVDPTLRGANTLAERTINGSIALRNPQKKCSAEYVEKWDSSVGPFNHLEGAQGDILLGAAHILRANSRDTAVSLETLQAQQNPEDVADAFLDLVDGLGDMEGQRPTHALLIGGQLVSKAGMTFEDRDRQDDFRDISSRLYRRIATANKPWCAEMHQASQYLADNYFHEISQGIREARRSGRDVVPYQDEAAKLLHGQLSDLFKMPETPDFYLKPQCLSGKSFELLSSIVARRAIYLDPKIKSTHPEVRTAFNSEDCPEEPIGRKVDTKFDMVIDWCTSTGEVTGAEPWQLKSGNSMDMHSRDYHPGIRVIEVRDIGTGAIIDAARGLYHLLHDGAYNRSLRPLRRVQNVFDPLVSPRRAA